MHRRLELIKHTILKRSLRGSLGSWAMNCFCPPWSMLARRKIAAVETRGCFTRFQFKGCQGWLYVPECLDVRMLHQTIVEQLYPWHWHSYQIAQTKVTSEDIVFDCGCAEGIFAFLNQGVAKRIYAFEPLPAYLGGLDLTFRGSPTVAILNCALGESTGKAYLEEAGISSRITTNRTGTPVEIETIDNMCRKLDVKVSYIKADLEGYEMQLLKGAPDAIREYRPKIAITTYHRNNNPAEMIGFLKSLVPTYRFFLKGIELPHGAPVMLHAWHEGR